MKNHVYESFRDISLELIRNPMIVVYDNPIDFPNKFVARVWDSDISTYACICKDNIDEIRSEIKNNFAWMLRFEPQHGDDSVIYEIWA